MKRIAALALAFALAVPSSARAQACYGSINWQKVYNGFQSVAPPGGDFSSGNSYTVDGSGAVVVTVTPFNPEQIVLGMTQDLLVKYLFNETGNSGVIGWFYWDQIAGNPKFYDAGSGTLVDKDNDGIKDLFQWAAGSRALDGLWSRAQLGNPLPDFLYAPYSDGGFYPHVPNLLENFFWTGSGNIAFGLTNDGPGTTTANALPMPLLPMFSDVKSDIAGGDGIPDYDVNFDGIVGNELDRSADLGTIQGGREIVFFYMSYGGDPATPASGWTVNNAWVGVGGAGTQITHVMPFFSKSILNADSYANGLVAGQAIASFDASCAWPGPCGAGRGWINNAALARLNTATYGSIAIPGPQTTTVVTTPGGFMPHVAAPLSSSWVLGFEDSPIPKGACAGCTGSDSDYNDAVVVIDRTNGATVSSQVISTDIPAGQLASTTISKVRVLADVTFPAPCPTPPPGSTLGSGQNTRVEIYYSANGGVSWQPVPFPASANVNEGVSTVDLIAAGVTGSSLMWRAVLLSDADGCTPRLTNLSVGYQAYRHGTYQQTEPIPFGNVLFRAQFETPASSWIGTEKTNRGHVVANQIFDLDAVPQVDYADPTSGLAPPLLWDAGTVLSTRNPDTRVIYWNLNGTLVPFSTGAATRAALDQALLPSSPANSSCNFGATGIRCARSNGKYVYDSNGDFDVTDADADWLVQWSRGWSLGTSKTTARSWPLGAIVRGTPAIVGPPGQPWWYDDSSDAALKSAITSFENLWHSRRAITVAGAQDGMIHAFDSGQFQWGDDPTTNLIELNGYFAHPSNNPSQPRDYGNGAELWAVIPASEVPSMRNNLPSVAGYQSGMNPRASVDAAITVSDVCLRAPAISTAPGVAPFCAFATVALVAETRTHPYVTAIDITKASWKPSSAQPAGTAPRAIWTADWTDADFQGSDWGPSVGPVLDSNGNTRFMAAVTSGVAAQSVPRLYLYLIDLSTGTTAVKAQLNINGNGVDCSVGTTGGVIGSIGSPVMVDSDHDGLVDRVYVADSSGCLYKYNTHPTSGQPAVCPLAAVGETVFAPIGVNPVSDVTNHIQIFLGGGDNPDRFDLRDGTAVVPPGGYHLFGFQDDDAAGTCRAPSRLFTAPLRPANAGTTVHKLWAAPSFSNDAVYVATSVGDELDPCNQDPTHAGVIESFHLEPNQSGQAVALFPAFSLGAGDGTGGVRLFDNHIFTNSLSGTTTVIGLGRNWNINPGANKKPAFGNPIWMER